MPQKVAVVRVKDVSDSVKAAIDLVGGFTPVKGSNIIIKPNLCSSSRSADSGVTTDVRVVEALIQYLKKFDNECKITIVESDSEGTAVQAFRRLGYNELGKKYGIKLKSLSKDTFVKLDVPDGKKLLTLEVPETLLFMDYFISVAKLKTQVLEKYSGIWKNQFGCIPKKAVRPRLHPFLPEVLFDLNRIYWPDLCLIDGITALEGPGPLEGTPKKMNLIICGKNALSVDIVGSKIVGFKPWQVAHLKFALKHIKDAENISLVGDGISLTDGSERLQFITWKQHFLYRVGLRLGRTSRYLSNLGALIQNASYALRAVGLSDLAEGKVLSTRSLISEAKNLLLKVETSPERA